MEEQSENENEKKTPDVQQRAIARKVEWAKILKFVVDVSNLVEQICILFLFETFLRFDILFWIFFAVAVLANGFDVIPITWVKVMFFFLVEIAQVNVCLLTKGTFVYFCNNRKILHINWDISWVCIIPNSWNDHS